MLAGNVILFSYDWFLLISATPLWNIVVVDILFCFFYFLWEFAMPQCILKPWIWINHTTSIFQILFHSRIIEIWFDKINDCFHFHTTPFLIHQHILPSFHHSCIFRLRCIGKCLCCNLPYFCIYISFRYISSLNQQKLILGHSALSEWHLFFTIFVMLAIYKQVFRNLL